MYLFLGTSSLLEKFPVLSVKLVTLYVGQFQGEIVSEGFEESQDQYDQQVHVQRNLKNQKGVAWAILMIENLVRYGVTVSKSNSGQKESVT